MKFCKIKKLISFHLRSQRDLHRLRLPKPSLELFEICRMLRRFIGLKGQAVNWGQLHLPMALRSRLGSVLLVAGLFGFLPILGSWMIPLGLAPITLDIPPLRRRLRQWLVSRVKSENIGPNGETFSNVLLAAAAMPRTGSCSLMAAGY